MLCDCESLNLHRIKRPTLKTGMGDIPRLLLSCIYHLLHTIRFTYLFGLHSRIECMLEEDRIVLWILSLLQGQCLAYFRHSMLVE